MELEVGSDEGAVQRLSRDLRKATATLSPHEARFLVDLYYMLQKNRLRAGNQVRAMSDNDEPHATLAWVLGQTETLEDQVRGALDAWSKTTTVGLWSRSICGIGPVIAAGLMAHIDIKIATNPSKIWRFAGLDPTVKWNKGEKRPWNASLKRLCWIMGKSFVKVQGRDSDFYGAIYARRKKYEWERNLAGLNREEAARGLVERSFGKDTKARAWREGRFRPGEARAAIAAGKLLDLEPGDPNPADAMLPPGQLDLRAMRVAVKLFLSHWWEVAWQVANPGQTIARPWVFAVAGHSDRIPPPLWPMVA